MQRKHRRRWAGVLGLLLSVLVVGVGPARAQEAGAFARVGFGARGIGGANALVADVSGDASTYYNPALAPFVTRENLAASAALMSFDRQLQFLQFSTPIRPRGGITFGVVHAGVSGIDGRDDSGYHTETYDTDEYLVFATFGVRLTERVSAGLSAKFFRADYGLDDVDPIEAVGLDLGLTARLTEHFTLGMAASDLLARFEWDTSGRYGSENSRRTTDRLPARLRVGGSYRFLDEKAQLMAEYESRFTYREERTRRTEVVSGRPRERTETRSLTVHESDVRVGGTYRFVDALAVRAGLDQIVAREALRPSAGFTIDQDIGRLPVRVTYGFSWDTAVNTAMHLLTLRLFL